MRGEFYKMEYEAWDEGTDRLTLEQEGAYLRFCHQMYRRKSSVVDDKLVLARLWKCHPNKAARLRADLIELGKIAETGDGHLTNTRVTQELDTRETQSTQRSNAGKTGGRRSGEVRRNALKNNDADEAIASSKTNQRRGEERRDSEPNGSGAGAPMNLLGGFRPPEGPAPSDPDYWRKLAFSAGVQTIRRLTGKGDSAARTIVGKWMRDTRDDARRVIRAIEDAEAEQAIDPVAWISRALSQRQRGRPSQSVEDMLFARH